MNDLRQLSDRLRTVIGLEHDAVGVFLLNADSDLKPFENYERVQRHRYCQLLMKARSGKSVLLEAAELACPAAAAAFGLRNLPEGLAQGKGLVGFGIVAAPETGKRMFEKMPHLAPGTVKYIAAAPLPECLSVPDVVVVEDLPERLMWLLLADLNVAGGERRTSSTAVLQATCVDSTIIPMLENRLNFTFGCYGCREATDIGPNEAVLGFPGDRLQAIVEALAFLAEKAIPRSRAKTACSNVS
ncbi:MAG: DUF169 domain-containing protein [candidate division WOR-3 bacterium]|nr:DUF169 domain-containing protein [candidate division WOR-3 bacterium]